MHSFRRAALRALAYQQPRNLSALRQPWTSRMSDPRPSQTIARRSFHQARIWRSDAEEKKVEDVPEVIVSETEPATETVTVESTTEEVQEPTAEEVQELNEGVVAEAEAAEASAEVAADEPALTPEEDAADPEATSAEIAAAAASTASAAAAQPARPQEPPGTRYNDRSNASSSGRDVRPSRVVYVGNLFFEVTAPQLESEFVRYGEITNSRVVTDSRGLSKGFGYIEFANQDSADRAVRELDQKVFQGRRMAVQYHVRREARTIRPGFGSQDGRPRNPPSKTLFIGNMSYQMSDRDLNDLFREIRDVLDVRVAIDRRSGQPRGFAHADFIDVAAAERAKAHLEKKVVYGRQLRIDFSTSSSMNQQSP